MPAGLVRFGITLQEALPSAGCLSCALLGKGGTGLCSEKPDPDLSALRQSQGSAHYLQPPW